MRLSTRFIVFGALGMSAMACGKKPEPEQPAPAPAPTTAPTTTPTTSGEDAAARAAREAAERDRAAREAADLAAKNKATAMAQLTAMINFDLDKFDIRPDDQGNLDRKAAILQANSGVKVRISGHADERGSDEYNLALGNRRATSAKRYLSGKGIDGARIETVSYGEERPLDPGHDESAWFKNRRDEFEVTAGDANLVLPR
jgi:peptidoglycan-associated lipoprotein